MPPANVAPDPLDPDAFRPRLLALAYRMLGSVADAEDAVQDAYLRLHLAQARAAGGDGAAIGSADGWLVRTLTRICVDRLRRARRRREYVGPWLPEPAGDGWPGAAADRPALAESLSMAFLVLLETLSPTERATYLLREVFDYDFAEIAALLGKTPVNARQILARARKRLDAPGQRLAGDRDAAEALAGRFVAACRAGDIAAIEGMLAPDAVLVSDGGGKTRAATRPVTGRYRIAHMLAVTYRKRQASCELREVRVNGQPGVAFFRDGAAVQVTSIAVEAGRVVVLHSVLNPDKLRPWADPASAPE